MKTAPVREGRGTHKALASGAEAGPRRRHDVALVQDFRKYVPRWLAGKAHPHVGRVVAAIHAEAQLQERLRLDECTVSSRSCVLSFIFGFRWQIRPLISPATQKHTGCFADTALTLGAALLLGLELPRGNKSEALLYSATMLNCSTN